MVENVFWQENGALITETGNWADFPVSCGHAYSWRAWHLNGESENSVHLYCTCQESNQHLKNWGE